MLILMREKLLDLVKSSANYVICAVLPSKPLTESIAFREKKNLSYGVIVALRSVITA